MADNEIESGFELVLDNRRMIAAFAVLIVICGCFFIWGYAMGKRQGKIAALSGADTEMNGSLAPASGGETAEGQIPSITADGDQKDLEWYRSGSKGDNNSAGAPASSRVSDNERRSASSGAPYVSSTNTKAVSYSVQVGAFKTRKQAEVQAEDVRSKGFQSRVEAPGSSGNLYRVKVGTFGTRKEADAEQLRLQKKGYKTLIKTN